MLPAVLVSLAGFGLCAPQAGAETRHYAISWFAMATNSSAEDCSGGVHPVIEEIYLQYASHLGAAQKQITAWREKMKAGQPVTELYELMMTRGRIDGKPVNPYAHPAAVVDLHLPGLDGQYAYGFDLDGKGVGDPDGFEDPETHQRGVDHQLYRATGCSRAFRGTLASRPTYYAWAWGQLKSSQPVWLITLTGEDLDKGGPVTVGIDRALEHLRFNSNGTARFDSAYRVDPDPRSHNSFQGVLKDGTVTITEHGSLRLLRNPLVGPELNLDNFHMRLTLNPDRTARGFMGGYQPWHPIFWAIAGLGFGGEQQVSGDIPGFYHLLKRYADADPDPETGRNRAISATYYIEAIPAFAAPGTEVTAWLDDGQRE